MYWENYTNLDLKLKNLCLDWGDAFFIKQYTPSKNFFDKVVKQKLFNIFNKFQKQATPCCSRLPRSKPPWKSPRTEKPSPPASPSKPRRTLPPPTRKPRNLRPSAGPPPSRPSGPATRLWRHSGWRRARSCSRSPRFVTLRLFLGGKYFISSVLSWIWVIFRLSLIFFHKT